MSKFTVKPVTGGLSNVLHSVSHSDQTILPRKALVRIYGAGMEEMINRSYEVAATTALGELGIGPKIYGNFSEGRVEEFLEARNISSIEMRQPKVQEEIARKLAHLHSCSLPGVETDRSHSHLESRLDLWLEDALRVSFSRESDFLNFQRLKAVDFAHLKKQIKWLKTEFARIRSPVVLCHYDLQAGNIMRSTTGSDELFFIDMEYSCYDYRGIDFGNFFSETSIENNVQAYPGFAFNFDHYPSVGAQRAFFTNYLIASGRKEKEISETELTQMQHEAEVFAMATHMMWALWGITQSKASQISFGYLEYALQRLDFFHHQQKRYLAARKSHL